MTDVEQADPREIARHRAAVELADACARVAYLQSISAPTDDRIHKDAIQTAAANWDRLRQSNQGRNRNVRSRH